MKLSNGLYDSCPDCGDQWDKEYIEWCFARRQRMECLMCGWVCEYKMPLNWYARIPVAVDFKPRIVR